MADSKRIRMRLSYAHPHHLPSFFCKQYLFESPWQCNTFPYFIQYALAFSRGHQRFRVFKILGLPKLNAGFPVAQVAVDKLLNSLYISLLSRVVFC